MRGIMSKIIIMMFICASLSFPADSFAKGAKRLLTINDIDYTVDDYVNWLRHWRDKNNIKFPENPDEFVDFQLMVQQGREMGYDNNPNYLRKLNVFLQVRAMMALKAEEVDSKADVTDADIKKYFNENFADIWALQILAFSNETKARKAYEFMLPLNGQVAGRLVFADLYGGSAEDKPDTYDEVSISVADFHKNKKDSWLAIVKKLKAGEVCQPFANDDKYILLRLIEKRAAGEEALEEKRQRIKDLLNKEKRNRLTIELLEKLKKKYALKVDKALFDEIKLDAEYPKEFLDRKLVTMNDFEATVNDLLYNTVKEKNQRKNVPDETIKEIVLDSIISQTLINKESLARGYEKKPPLQATYDFYKQNRLIMEVDAGLMNTIVASDQDLQKYYDANIASYSVPEKDTFFFLEGGEDVIKKIWFGVLQGGDYNELAKKYSLDAMPINQGVDSLAPVLVAELKKIDKGGVSSPFAIDGTYGLLKLVDRVPGQIQPFAQVKNNVLEQFKKQKFDILKAEYLGKLKSKSRIDVDKRVWDSLSREFADGKKN